MDLSKLLDFDGFFGFTRLEWRGNLITIGSFPKISQCFSGTPVVPAVRASEWLVSDSIFLGSTWGKADDDLIAEWVKEKHHQHIAWLICCFLHGIDLRLPLASTQLLHSSNGEEFTLHMVFFLVKQVFFFKFQHEQIRLTSRVGMKTWSLRPCRRDSPGIIITSASWRKASS